MNARGTSAGIIAKWLKTGKFPDRLLQGVASDHAFVMELVYGVVRWKRLLEWSARRCAEHLPDPGVKAFLLVGLYQILLMDDVELYASVSETVEASKKRFGRKTTGFINAVLRNAAGNRDALKKEIAGLQPGVRFSHPDLLIDRWRKRFGGAAVEKLCAWNNSRPGVTIFANRLVAQDAVLENMLKDGRVGYQTVETGLFTGFQIESGWKIQALPGYKNGAFIVADPSVVHAVRLLDPKPGECVLDACAAPGGKTVLIASLMRGTGRLAARDIHQDRLDLLKDTLERCGCGFASVEKADSRKKAADTPVFDKILVDSPCTNTGVIRRRPDVRWRFSLKTLAKLNACQYAMLDSLSLCLKPGGRLVYSTCSLEDEENSLLVDRWLSKNPGFRKTGDVKIVPPDNGCDGAYAVALLRESSSDE